MRLLLDEVHAPAVAVELRARGCDAVAVKERPDLAGREDPDLLAAATVQDRALVTENVKDFVVLHQRLTAAGERHSGLVLTHPRRFPRAARNHVRVLTDALTRFIQDHASTLDEVDSFVWWLTRADGSRGRASG